MAQEHVLAASAARTADATGTGVHLPGFWSRMMVVLDVTAAAAAAGDKLDVYLDFSLDGTKWFNVCRFAQQLGNGGIKTEYAIFDPSNPGAVTIAATSDCAAGASRPSVFGKQVRARWDTTDAGGGLQSFTFSVKAYTQ